MITDAEKFGKEFVAALNSHDVKKIISYYTDDAVYVAHGMEIIKKGKKEIEEHFNGVYAVTSDIRFEIRNLFYTDELLCMEWTMNGINSGDLPGLPATGKSFSIKGIGIQKFKGDKICYDTSYHNQATVLRQLGVIPEMAEAR